MKITPQEVQFINNHPKSYTDLVEDAKVLLHHVALYRLKIAKMALKACDIRHGGRSTGYYTLTDFAKDIGCHRKDLSEWVLTYKRVARHLESKIKTDADFNAARRVSDKLAKEVSILKKAQDMKHSKTPIITRSKEEIRKMFVDELVRNPKNGKSTHSEVYKARDYVLKALGLLQDARDIKKYEKSFVYDINEKCSEIIQTANQIQEHTIRIMGELK